jgi:predicted PurR-regulated permease PerM
MQNLPKSFNSGRAVFFLMVFICCILAVAVLKIASSVLLPFTIAILLAFVTYPLVKLMDKLHLPRFLAVLLVVIIMVAFLWLFGMVLFTSGKMIAAQYSRYENRFTEVYVWIAQFFELSYDESLSIWENLWGQLGVRTAIQKFTLSSSSLFINFLRDALIVAILVAFFLAEASYFKEKLETAFKGQERLINRMGQDIMSQVSRYLTAKFLISLANGLIFGVAFYLVGLEFAVVWGILQFILNFIPTLGSIVAGFIFSLFALVQFWPDPGPVILIVVIVLAVNLILGNILDPKIIGEHVGISPLMIIASLAIWGFIWGFAGMVIAVPMTVIIKIVCENIPMMEPVSILIGSRRSVKAKKSEIEKAET